MAGSNAAKGLVLRATLMSKTCWNQCGSWMSTATTGVGVRNEVKPFGEIPGPKGLYQWPVIGTALHFKPFTKYVPENSGELVDKMFDKYGPIFKWQFGSSVVMVCDPADIETVFRNEGKYPVRPLSNINVLYSKRNRLKPSLTDRDGEMWHSLRAPLNKRLMKVDSAQHYLVPQNQVADEFVHILATRNMSCEELSELFFSYAAESIGVVCFNARLGFLDIKALTDPMSTTFLKLSKDIFVILHQAQSQVSHNWFKTKTYRNYEHSRLTIKKNAHYHIEKAKRVLDERRREGTLNPDEPNLLLSLLSDQSLDSEDISESIETLYTAGTDSTAKNLQTFLYNLAVNPDKQDKMREEIHQVLGRDGPVTAEALAKLTYLKAGLKESFRLHYPTISGTRRLLPCDVTLSGYRVPSGTTIGLHNPKTCRDYFVNADQFIPERWLRTACGHHTEDIPKLASLPFGYGPKNCLGRRFAEQEIYLAVAKVLQKLRIEIDPASPKTNFIYTLFIQPEQPIQFRFTRLDS